MLKNNEVMVDFEKIEKEMNQVLENNGIKSIKSDLCYSTINGKLRIDFSACSTIKTTKKMIISVEVN